MGIGGIVPFNVHLKTKKLYFYTWGFPSWAGLCYRIILENLAAWSTYDLPYITGIAVALVRVFTVRIQDKKGINPTIFRIVGMGLGPSILL